MPKFYLSNPVARTRAVQFIRDAPDGYVATIEEQKRTLDQSAKMWAMLRDVSRQVKWPVDGELQLLQEVDWKAIFTGALKRHQRMAKGIDGGLVVLGESTSRMSKKSMSELIELMMAFGADRDEPVIWSEQPEARTYQPMSDDGGTP